MSRGTEEHLCNVHRPREGIRPSPEGGDLENHEREAGTRKKYVELVQDRYTGCRTMVRTVAGESSKFNVEVGLHQGSALSPYLFLILVSIPLFCIYFKNHVHVNSIDKSYFIDLLARWLHVTDNVVDILAIR